MLNRLLTRDLLRERTERDPSEARLGFAPRRKSERKELSSDGMGSDIPIRVPVELRNVFRATLSPGGSLFLRCLRIQTAMRRAATAPNTAPGKNPAITALVGKAEQLPSSAAEYCESVGVGVMTLEESVVGEPIAESGLDSVADSIEVSVEVPDKVAVEDFVELVVRAVVVDV